MSTQPAVQKKLKWHRFLQFVGLPFSLVVQGLNLVTMISDIFGLNLPLGTGLLKQILTQLGTDVYHLGPYFWPVVGLMAFSVFSFILTLFAWIGSFRWRSYSWKCWIVFLFFNTVSLAILLYFTWFWMTEKGGMVVMAQDYQARTGRELEVSTELLRGILIFFIALMALAVIYFLLNFIYYFKRRKMYTNPAVQQPYETDDDDDGQEEVYSHQSYRHEPQQKPLQPAPEETVLLDVPVQKSAEEPKPEKDEIAELLEDVENDITSLKKEETSEVPAFKPLRAEPAVTEEIPVSRIILPDLPEEDNAPIVLSSAPRTPVKEAEPEYIPPVKNFCPQCGAKITDPEMNFCIRCGKRIR